MGEGIEMSDMDARQLEVKFDGEMLNIYKRAKKEAGYNATRFLQMLDEHRGLETARILLRAATVSEGYTALWQRKRLDLTVEALVLQSEFAEFFTGDELETARSRLAEYGYRPSG